MDVATSVNGVPIRLTDERWAHILEQHPELETHRSRLLEILGDPDFVAEEPSRALRAVGTLTGSLKLVVLYRETRRSDGFVITCWPTSRRVRGKVIWTRQ